MKTMSILSPNNLAKTYVILKLSVKSPSLSTPIPSAFTLHYLICFSRQEGVCKLDVPCWFALFWWFFGLLGWGPSFFDPCIPTFFGCFDLFMIGRVSFHPLSPPLVVSPK